jgi:hypothetical protein
MLAYGIPTDLIDDHLAMGESTSILCVKRFAVAIVNVFRSTYLRAPNAQDTTRLLEFNADRGFPCMLGSIDCMHWSWKNCPAACHGQFKGYKKDPTIVLEAVADWCGTVDDVNHRLVGNPKRKVWWAQQQAFPSRRNQGLSNPGKSQTPEGDAC